MPTPKSKRDLILKSSVTSATVTDLNITMDAVFDTNLSTVITYEDETPTSTRDEKTKYKMVFSNGAGASLGTITLRLVGDPTPADAGVTVTNPVARFTFDPAGRETAVALLASPTASFERVWKQKAYNSARVEMVDNVAKIDVRVIGENGAVVTQTVKSTDDGELVLLYEWSSATAGVLVSGSVTLTTTAASGAGYTLGNIRVTDSDPSPNVRRR